jgi:hypothetical protein
MSRWMKRAVLVLLAAAFTISLTPSAASATIDGPCEGRYTLSNGEVLDGGRTQIEVDREALKPTGTYFGQHNDANPGEDRSHSGGFVKADIPGTDITFGTWDPVAQTREVSKQDTYTPFDLIDQLPPIKVTVFGQHHDSAGNCDGEVVLVFKGEGPFDTLYWVVAIVLAVILLAVILLLSKRGADSTGGKRFGKAILGLLLAIILAVTIVFIILLLCWADTGDDWLLIVMIVIAVLGFVLPLWSPFGRGRGGAAVEPPPPPAPPPPPMPDAPGPETTPQEPMAGTEPPPVAPPKKKTARKRSRRKRKSSRRKP